MTVVTDQRFINALQGKTVGRPPIWLMRQAGRYLPQFRKIREKYGFLQVCKTPELVAEITLQPIQYLGVDAAILFCDILVVLDAMERGLSFQKGLGPVIDRVVRNKKDLKGLIQPDIGESLAYVGEGIRACKERLDVPLIGFCGAPFTVASYLVEGGSSVTCPHVVHWMESDPEGFLELLFHLTKATISYCKMQIEAGVEALQVFESWGSLLSPLQFEQFCKPCLQQITDAIRPTGVPIILFSRGDRRYIDHLADCRPNCIGVDWSVDLLNLRQDYPGLSLQGNINPEILYQDRTAIKQHVDKLLDEMEGDAGYICNLGHGLRPDMDPEKVRFFVEQVTKR